MSINFSLILILATRRWTMKNSKMVTISLGELLWQIHMDCDIRTERSNTSKKESPILNLKVEVNPYFFKVKQ